MTDTTLKKTHIAPWVGGMTALHDVAAVSMYTESSIRKRIVRPHDSATRLIQTMSARLIHDATARRRRGIPRLVFQRKNNNNNNNTIIVCGYFRQGKIAPYSGREFSLLCAWLMAPFTMPGDDHVPAGSCIAIP
jgi:hypothetical protein